MGLREKGFYMSQDDYFIIPNFTNLIKSGGDYMKRLPKGFGSVYKLSGSRRKPYRACKLVDGKYITIGYYESSAAAVQALTDYNKNPYDLTSKDVTKQKGGLTPPHNH